MNRQSPFPGMDPWLERSWGDIHSSLITYIRDGLNAVLPAQLAARTEERVFIESPILEDRKFIPGVRVIEYPRLSPGPESSAIAIAEPATELPVFFSFELVEMTDTFIEIKDFGSDGRVITLIELVSLSNKSSGEGRDKYLQKQNESVAGGVNVVEIDLLRS